MSALKQLKMISPVFPPKKVAIKQSKFYFRSEKNSGDQLKIFFFHQWSVFARII